MNWRPLLFRPNTLYRVKTKISELGHQLKAGEIVELEDEGYDPHSGVTRYWLRVRGTDRLEVWHLWDDEPNPQDIWSEMFEVAPRAS